MVDAMLKDMIRTGLSGTDVIVHEGFSHCQADGNLSCRGNAAGRRATK